MPPTNRPAASPVASVRHTDTRVNIPTEELRDFVPEDGQTPPLLYPRDVSLDPQLVWRGKDEQNETDLAVPVVPVYIQEKIHPQALVEDVRAQAQPAGGAAQLDLFGDFNGVDDFADLVDFYHHEQHWTNRLILGDSLLAMTSLAEKEGLRGKVQCIYVDPPYGIKFNSNWQVSTRKRDVKDGKAEDLTRQPEQIKAYRDTWELGIHSYLTYLRDRLTVARDLLTESGSIFVQIGDENVHLVRSLLDEVFGRENFVSQIAFTKTAGGLAASSRVSSRFDYLLWYCKNTEEIKYRPLYEERTEPIASGYVYVELPGSVRRSLSRAEREDERILQRLGGRLFRPDSLTKPGPGAKYTIEYRGKTFDSGNRWWGTPKESIDLLIRLGRVDVFGNSLRYIAYSDDFPYRALSNLWEGFVGASDPTYVVQTNTEIVQRCLLMTTDPGDLVLDPTCGSGTTAYVAEQWGRRWITMDTSRVALALARTRLMTARFPYYLLADSPEGARKDAELTGVPPSATRWDGDIKQGFVYRRVPHITLKSIANNPDIHAGMTRAEIDAAIARHAESETLYDQPYEDTKRVRVAGPFTVESLSPHRQISVGQKVRHAEKGIEGVSVRVLGGGQFALTIMDYLRKAGVQNRVQGERLTFDRLEPFAGEWLQGEGEYTEAGATKRVAVCIGPEYGTVGPDLVKEAAKEALRGVGFDTLVVCGFAFDPHVGLETRHYGRLLVLPAKMNPDLAMGDDLLKKTGAGNLFMVFGEPDIAISHDDGQVVVEIRGVDVYDPTSGQLRSNSTDDIACWFIDTNYNEESFFVRHAYFTGADQPYDKLKRALRAEIDEAAWAALYRTTSRPFPPPATGKIAVKVINHYGDEVLKVYEVKAG